MSLNLEMLVKLVFSIPYKDFTLKKEPFDNRIRNFVLRRDGYVCKMCGEKTTLHVHHIIPNGNAGPDNLISLCGRCHEDVHVKLRKRGYKYYRKIDGYGNNYNRQYKRKYRCLHYEYEDEWCDRCNDCNRFDEY